jgi:diguanylate cyclase (GGDEF)-like protein
MRILSFRHKVLMLAVALVLASELVTLFPVLNAIKRDADAQARRTVGLAGTLFDEYMRNRAEQLATTVNVLVSDYGFKQAVAGGDEETIRSALINHAGRVGATVATLVDLDGAIAVSSTDAVAASGPIMIVPPAGAPLESAGMRVVFFGGVPYQTVAVPLRAPVTIAWVVLGFPIDDALALHLRNLTGLDVSFVRAAETVRPIASTLLRDAAARALAGLEPSGHEPQLTGGDDSNRAFLTLLKPFSSANADVYVALQLSLDAATASYRSIRNILLAITSLSLLLAIVGSFWLAKTVTRPVQHLVAGARRMREGVYDEPIAVRSRDELGELALSFNAMQDAIADREQRIYHQAHHDGLSGLPNRELAINELKRALERANIVSVVSLALARFGGIVSSLGHGAGDEVVKLAAAVLRSRVSDGQILGHFSGHEFLVALPGCDAQQAIRWIEHLADVLRAGVQVGGASISLQAAAGIACYPEHGRDAADLCRRAAGARSEALAQHLPVALYRMGQEDRELTQIRIIGDFPRALAGDELRLAFQPKIDCRTRAAIGVEALVRWQHPALGVLAPDAFIRAIEQAGGIAHLTRWVIKQAIARCGEWRARGEPLAVAVNISVDDLADEYLPYFLLDLVRTQRLKPADVTLEVTESAIMHNVGQSLAVVSCIHELGFRIAIDDFGTGHSALAQLKRLPVDELKIDKSFIMHLDDRKDEAIVRTTIELAHELGLSVVAEGVESEQVLDRLAMLGCEYAQGYAISKPLPPTDLADWLAQRRASGAVIPLATRRASS